MNYSRYNWCLVTRTCLRTEYAVVVAAAVSVFVAVAAAVAVIVA